MLKINENFLDASLVRAGDKLTLGLTGDQPIEELLAMLNPETAPEIRVLDDEGGTVAIYRGHALTAVTIEPGEPRRITATLQVQPIEQSDTAENHRRGARGGACGGGRRGGGEQADRRGEPGRAD